MKSQGQRRLEQQARSRQALEHAVRRYVALRSADGKYTATVHAPSRDGVPMVVLVTLDILSEGTETDG